MGGAVSLNTIGMMEATDKGTSYSDFLRHYESRFSGIRNEAFNLLEIGVASGGSMRTWRRFFPSATIVGIDIMELCRKFGGDRVVIEIGSQDDRAFITDVATRYPPTIVIDDGSHKAEHIMVSFETLFPMVLPGGWYVVEDMYMIYGRSEVPVSPHDFFPDIARRVMLGRGSISGDEPAARFARQIDSIELISGAVIIRRKDEAAIMAGFAEAEQLAESLKNPHNWFFLAHGLMHGGAGLDRAEAAIRKAVTLADKDSRFYDRLSDILHRKGDLPGAIEAASNAVRFRPGVGGASSPFQQRLDTLLAEQRKRSGAA